MPIPKGNERRLADGDHDFEEVIDDRMQPSTVSIALPSSILANAQSPELRMYLGGQIARAAAIFNIDEIVIFEEDMRGESNKDSRRGSRDTQLTSTDFLKLILEFLETPQYLRKHLFPMSSDLRLVGLLNPLALPSHVAKNECTRWREGIAIGRPNHGRHLNRRPGDRKSTTEPMDSAPPTRFVDVGQERLVEIDVNVPVGERVTIDMEPSGREYDACPGKYLFGRLADREAPRRADGLYWGYSVRIAASLSEVFSNSSLSPKGYDLTVGTSERGTPIHDDVKGNGCFALPEFSHLLIVFGGVHGLERSVRGDHALEALGISETEMGDVEGIASTSHTVGDLFDFYVNTCPNQGSRTIRSEEAILISLAALQPHLRPLGGSGRH